MIDLTDEEIDQVRLSGCHGYIEFARAIIKAIECKAALAVLDLRGHLQIASEWIATAPHGDNCYLHDDGGEYDACFCGKASLMDALDTVLAAPTTGPATEESPGATS